MTPVPFYGLDDWRASIRYYTDRPITHLDQVDDVRPFLDESPHGYVVMLRTDYVARRDAGVELQGVAARRAIVGRTGKYFRRQIWERLAVVTHADHARTLVLNEADIQ